MLQVIADIILYIPRRIYGHFRYIHEIEKEIIELNREFTMACKYILKMSEKAIEGYETNAYNKTITQFEAIREIGKEAYLNLEIKEKLGFDEIFEDIKDDTEISLYDFMNKQNKRTSTNVPQRNTLVQEINQ